MCDICNSGNIHEIISRVRFCKVCHGKLSHDADVWNKYKDLSTLRSATGRRSSLSTSSNELELYVRKNKKDLDNS